MFKVVLFEDQYNVASGRPPQEPLAKKRKTEEEKKELNECQQTEEIEEVKNGRTSNTVECVTPPEEEDATDTKPPNVQVFHLAEIPAITETVFVAS